MVGFDSVCVSFNAKQSLANAFCSFTVESWVIYSIPQRKTRITKVISSSTPSFAFLGVQVPPSSGKRNLLIFCHWVGGWAGGGLPSSRSLARPGSAPVDRTKSDRTASISRVIGSCRRAAQHSAEVGFGSRLETIHLQERTERQT